MITDREAWLDDANCATTDPSLFVLDGNGGNYNAAAKICGSCTAVAACLDFALRNGIYDGFYGGLSPKQRARMGRAA